MDERNTIREISLESLFPEVIEKKTKGWRFVQMCASRISEGYEMSYSFNQGYEMETLRLTLGIDDEITSISQIYPCVYIQENEAAELFGIKIKNMSIDYRGKLIRTDRETPFKEKG